jgi:putative sporulation protein YtxC
VELARVGTSKAISRVQQRLHLFRDVLQGDGISVDIGEQQLGKSVFYCCYLKTNGVAEICRYQLAETIADIITEILQAEYIRRILRCHYTGFDRVEEGSICAEAQLLAQNPRRKRRIIFALLDYLNNHVYLHVDGFVRFRLPDYWEELVDCVDIAVGNFQDRKEHEEFVSLLRFFVDVQEPRLETVQIVRQNRGYVLLDSQQRPVDNSLLCGLSLEPNDYGASPEDLLLSALVTLSPSTIVLHSDEDPIFSTIGEVFSQRIRYCTGCSLCLKD